MSPCQPAQQIPKGSARPFGFERRRVVRRVATTLRPPRDRGRPSHLVFDLPALRTPPRGLVFLAARIPAFFSS